MNFDLKEPCSNCPFRPSVKFHLRRVRVREIVYGLLRDQSFACHKTTEHDDDGDVIASKKEQHCAGAAILLMRMRRPNQMMRIAMRLGMFDPARLSRTKDCYRSAVQMIAARHWEK